MEENFKTSSPTPQKQEERKQLSFGDACNEIVNGKKVTRLSWSNTDYGYLAQDGYLSINRNGVSHQWLVNDGDMLGLDWVVVE